MHLHYCQHSTVLQFYVYSLRARWDGPMSIRAALHTIRAIEQRELMALSAAPLIVTAIDAPVVTSYPPESG